MNLLRRYISKHIYTIIFFPIVFVAMGGIGELKKFIKRNNLDYRKVVVRQISKDELSVYVQDYTTARLMMLRDCDYIDMTLPAHQAKGDKSCHMFNKKGGALPYKDFELGKGCDLSLLEEGQTCSDLLYLGVINGNRVYTIRFNLGESVWSRNAFLMKGEFIIADHLCSILGPNWALPNIEELKLLFENKSLVTGFNIMTHKSENYWSSEFTDERHAYSINFADGTKSKDRKSYTNKVHCVLTQ